MYIKNVSRPTTDLWDTLDFISAYKKSFDH